MRIAEALVAVFSGDHGPLLKRAVVVRRKGLRLDPVTLADLASATISSSDALERAAKGALARPVGSPYQNFVKLTRAETPSKTDSSPTSGRLCWAILTTGYATRLLPTTGPGHPEPTPATAGVGTNLVLIDAVSGGPYRSQFEWASRADAGNAQ